MSVGAAYSVWYAAIVVLLLQGADVEDATRIALDEANAKFDRSLNEYRDLAKEFFNNKEEVARRQGNKRLVDQIKAEREVFETTGELPASASPTLRSRPEGSLAVLTAAYSKAIKEYTRKNQDELATATERELAVLRAKAGFPSIAGEWQEGPPENGIRIAITQNANKFTASCTYQHEKYGEISWRMTGTIAEDGSLKGTLVHTKAPRNFVISQARTGMYSPSDETITGRAVFDGGMQDFEWKLLSY